MFLFYTFTGKQDLEACNFDDLNDTSVKALCHFEAVNWFHDKYTYGGPRFDHTTGAFGGRYPTY